MSSRHKGWAKTLRIIGIVLMSLTAALTILGGAGTSCVALNPTGYEGKFAGIAPILGGASWSILEAAQFQATTVKPLPDPME